jgi:hypothetical protein
MKMNLRKQRLRTQILALGLIAAVAAPLAVVASDAHDHQPGAGYREHGPHVHGVGDLNVALEGSGLLIELHGPAANIVGFEHPPTNAAETQAVDDARARLADPARTFQPNAEAGCELSAVEVFMELAGDQPGPGHDHGHDHDHGHEGETHSDAGVAYSFECASPGALKTLRARLFEQFPGTERLRVQLITPNGQRADELTADAPTLAL